MFLICFSSAGVLSCALRLAFRALFDAEHRLHAHVLARRGGARPKDMLVALASSVHALARAVWQRCHVGPSAPCWGCVSIELRRFLSVH